MKFYGWVLGGTSVYILLTIWITMLTVQSEIRPLLNKLWADFDEIFIWLCNDARNNWLKLWGGLDHQLKTLQIENLCNVG